MAERSLAAGLLAVLLTACVPQTGAPVSPEAAAELRITGVGVEAARVVGNGGVVLPEPEIEALLREGILRELSGASIDGTRPAIVTLELTRIAVAGAGAEAGVDSVVEAVVRLRDAETDASIGGAIRVIGQTAESGIARGPANQRSDFILIGEALGRTLTQEIFGNEPA